MPQRLDVLGFLGPQNKAFHASATATVNQPIESDEQRRDAAPAPAKRKRRWSFLDGWAARKR